MSVFKLYKEYPIRLALLKKSLSEKERGLHEIG